MARHGLADVGLLCLFVALGISSSAVPRAYAMTEPAYCSTLYAANAGTTWVSTTNTCTFPGSGGQYTATSGTFEVTAGTTLNLENYAPYLNFNLGSQLLIDSGATVVAESSGGGDIFMQGGSGTSYGTIDIKNTAGYGIYISAGDFTNYGTIVIMNTSPGAYQSIGIDNYESFTNFGTVDIANSGSLTYGIYNHGTITNSGTMQNSFPSLGVTGTVFNTCGGVITGFTDYIQQTGCAPIGAPQFPLGPALLFALLVPALLVMRKKALPFGKFSSE